MKKIPIYSIERKNNLCALYIPYYLVRENMYACYKSDRVIVSYTQNQKCKKVNTSKATSKKNVKAGHLLYIPSHICRDYTNKGFDISYIKEIKNGFKIYLLSKKELENIFEHREVSHFLNFDTDYIPKRGELRKAMTINISLESFNKINRLSSTYNVSNSKIASALIDQLLSSVEV